MEVSKRQIKFNTNAKAKLQHENNTDCEMIEIEKRTLKTAITSKPTSGRAD